MLKALKYIVIFLLGYKIIKEIFGQKNKRKVDNKPTQNNSIHTQQNTNEKNQSFDNAEDIDFEELK